MAFVTFHILNQRVQKLQRERLFNEFTTALNIFQSLQREAAQKEKDEVKRVRSHSGLAPPESSTKETLLVIDEGQQFRPPQRQMQIMEEDVDVQALEERERAIRQLEVN